jgi:diguanylate cyclase (GGDEF)-like protein
VDYITKPFHRSLVKARVEAHLRIVEQMHMIEQLGLIDPLTGIPNRRSLDNHTALEWSRAAREGLPLSYLMIDIDHFKRYNDTFGHQQGDITLKAVAQVVKQAARRPADLAARWGGEEFAVLLPQTDACGALKLAEQIRAAVQASGAGVTVSVGVSSVVPTTEHSLEDFFGAADKALYRCKANGRNRVEGGEPT